MSCNDPCGFVCHHCRHSLLQTYCDVVKSPTTTAQPPPVRRSHNISQGEHYEVAASPSSLKWANHTEAAAAAAAGQVAR